MDFLIKFLNWVFQIVGSLLVAVSIPEETLTKIDDAMSLFIGLLNQAAYFFPVTDLAICITLILSVDIGMLMLRVGQWIINIIRG